jgi:hypothetical protein
MPCRDYYDDHPEQYFKEVTEPALKKRIAFAESALCAVLSVFDNCPFDEMWTEIDFKSAGITSEELAEWYAQHRARDQKIRDDKIQKARAKLTPEEIELLGLDKRS